MFKKTLLLLIILCTTTLCKAQYFSMEHTLLNELQFKNTNASNAYNSFKNKPADLDNLLNTLATVETQAELLPEDASALSVLKALKQLKKQYNKNAITNATLALKQATNSNNKLSISNANLMLYLINANLNAHQNAVENLNKCDYTNSIINYEIAYLKAYHYIALNNYTKANELLITTNAQAKKIAPYDYVKATTLLIHSTTESNNTTLALNYALQLDTMLTKFKTPSGIANYTNKNIKYGVDNEKELVSFFNIQHIANSNNIGFLYRKIGDYKNSEKYLLQSIAELKQYKNDNLLPESKINIGLTYTHLKRYTEAENNYEDALNAYTKQKNILKQTEVNNIIAKNYFLEEKPLLAIQHCNDAIALATPKNDYLNLSNSYFILSEVYAFNSDYQQSQENFKLFSDAKQLYEQQLTAQTKTKNDNELKAQLLYLDAEDEISNQEKKQLELIKIKLESKQKEQELLLIKQQNEINERTIQTQALEKQQALKSLALIKGQLEKEQLEQNINKINKEQEIKSLEAIKNKAQINLLFSQQKILVNERALKDLELSNQQKKQQQLKWGIALFGLLFTLFGYGFYTNYKQRKTIEITNAKLKESVDEIQNQKIIIENANQKIVDSINYSQRIQHSFLFDETKMAQYFKNSFVVFKPRDIVSGDFYLVTQKAHKTYIAVVDCTGHGVPGAMLSVIGYEEIMHLIKYNNYQPHEILTALNQKINSTLNTKNQIGSDGMDAMIVEIDTTLKTLKFAGARSTCTLVSNNNIVEIKGDRKSIGEKEDEHNFAFTQHQHTYNTNDKIYLYTDGYNDQFGFTTKKKLGSKLFKNTLCENVALPLNKQKQVFENVLNNWQENAKQTDDITLIAIQL
jgi:hypothetical protein